jgi:serine-type D-Ala-D-Ala carboxypeptidase (penicillin-binding protein 5/6)
VRVWMGEDNELDVGPADDLVMTIPRDSRQRLKAEMTVNPDIRAPIRKGTELGKVLISLDGDTLLERPLVALKDVEQAGFFKRIWHRIQLMFRNLF